MAGTVINIAKDLIEHFIWHLMQNAFYAQYALLQGVKFCTKQTCIYLNSVSLFYFLLLVISRNFIIQCVYENCIYSDPTAKQEWTCRIRFEGMVFLKLNMRVFPGCRHYESFKVNKFNFKGSNSAIYILPPSSMGVNGSQLLKKRICSPLRVDFHPDS